MSYHVVSADLHQNREDILRLWHVKMRERWPRSVLERRFTWFYERNPVSAPLTRLVVHTESGKVVGTASAIPRKVMLGDKIVQAGILTDFVIDPDHRLAGPALMVQRAIAKQSVEEGFAFLYGYPNQGAAALFPRLRFKKLHETSTWTRPLRTRKKIARYVHPITAALAAVLVDRVLAANDVRLSLSRLARLKRRPDCFPGPKVDELWERGSRRGGELMTVRSAEYLRWRYLDNPLQPAKMFCAEHPDGNLAGYVVYSVCKAVANVLDVFVDGDERLFEAVMLRFVDHARKIGAESVCVGYAGHPSVSRSLKSLQFIEHPDHRNVIAWVDKKQPAEVRQFVYDANHWRMFDGELDV